MPWNVMYNNILIYNFTVIIIICVADCKIIYQSFTFIYNSFIDSNGYMLHYLQFPSTSLIFYQKTQPTSELYVQ